MMETVQHTKMLDRKSFGQLTRETHRELLLYARSLTREDVRSRDIVQDSFLAAWKSMDKFDVSRDFRTWMRGIVRNKWCEALRANKRLISLDDDVLEGMEGEMLKWQEMRQDGGPGIFLKLEACLAKLPEGLLQAVKSFYYEGNNTDEAAAHFKIKGAAFRKRLERERENLRHCVNQ